MSAKKGTCQNFGNSNFCGRPHALGHIFCEECRVALGGFPARVKGPVRKPPQGGKRHGTHA